MCPFLYFLFGLPCVFFCSRYFVFCSPLRPCNSSCLVRVDQVGHPVAFPLRFSMVISFLFALPCFRFHCGHATLLVSSALAKLRFLSHFPLRSSVHYFFLSSFRSTFLRVASFSVTLDNESLRSRVNACTPLYTCKRRLLLIIAPFHCPPFHNFRYFSRFLLFTSSSISLANVSHHEVCPRIPGRSLRRGAHPPGARSLL